MNCDIDFETFTLEQLKNLYFNEAIEQRNFARKAQKHQAIMDFAHSLILKKMDEEDERITNLCREERELERRLARESKKKNRTDII